MFPARRALWDRPGATPDGYTISHGSTPTHVFNGAIFKLPFDVENDFQPISPIASGPLLIVAKKAVAANDLKEFITWLKADPGKAAQATGGVAATSHIAGMFFQQISGTRFTLVPYRGAGPAMQDLIAGQVDMMIDPAANTLPQVRAGRIKAFAITAKRRLALAPNIPDRGRIASTLFWPCEARTSTCRNFATISILQLHAELAHEGGEDREACVARGDRNCSVTRNALIGIAGRDAAHHCRGIRWGWSCC